MDKLRNIIREFVGDILVESDYWGIGGAGIVLICSEDNTVFLQKRANWVSGGEGQWSFPGGGIHPKGSVEQHYETPIDPDKRLSQGSPRFLKAAKREFKEESGWLPSFKVVDTYVFEDEGFIYKTFIADCKQKDKKKYSNRSHEVKDQKWVTIDEFNKMAKNGKLWDVSFNQTVINKVNHAIKSRN